MILPPEMQVVGGGYAPFDLTGQVAVVIGGTSGIGKALALALADAGAHVVASSRRADQVESMAAEIEQRGRRTIRIACNVTDRSSLLRLHSETLGNLGRIDILVNCAGKNRRTPTLDVTEDEWSDILATNLTGTLSACQVFGRSMLDQGYGRIINIASLASFVALFEVAAYAASKAAVASLTKSLAIEWASKGVCVNAIVPGVFHTPLTDPLINGTARGREYLLRTPMRRFGKVEELAGAAVFLASGAASFVTGQTLVVDGGFLASGVNQ